VETEHAYAFKQLTPSSGYSKTTLEGLMKRSP